MSTTKLTVGLEMLQDARDSEFSSAYSMLSKVLQNIISNPVEPKYRSLRKSNNKIAALLATRGVRAVLVGAGFEEEGDFLKLPVDTAVDGIEAALLQLDAQAKSREVAADEARELERFRRKDQAEKDVEERKRMKMMISDDAEARKQPGWTAKAAGVKGGRAITSCGDIGIGKGGDCC